LEDSRIDFYLFDAGAVEFFEGGYYAGFLAGAGRTVDEEMGKVAILCLDGGRLVFRGGLGEEKGGVRATADALRDHGGRSIDQEFGDGVCLQEEPWCCRCGGRGLMREKF